MIRAAICALALLCSSALAKPPLVVGISEGDYAPFYYDTENGMTGAAVEIVEHLATQQGRELEYMRLPWKRVQQYLAQGRIDLVMLYFKSPDRAEHVYYVEPEILYEASNLFVMAHNNISYNGDLNSLVEYRFGYVDGYWHGEAFDQFQPQRKKTYANSRALIAALQRGVIDIAVGNEAVIKHLLTEIGLRLPIEYLQPAIDYAPDYIAISRQANGAKPLLYEMSDALEAFTQTQRYEDILEKYGITDPRK